MAERLVDESRNAPARVLIIDDHRLFGESVAEALAGEADISVVGVVESAERGIQEVTALRPDIALVDYRLPGVSGTHLIDTIHSISPNTAVIVITAAEEEGVLLAAVQAGCAGFITKTAGLDEMRTAVRQVANGEAALDARALGRLLARLHRRSQSRIALTARERQILAGICAGRTNAEIARQLDLSVNTIRNQVQGVLFKLGAHSKLQAAAIAVREGLAEPTG